MCCGEEAPTRAVWSGLAAQGRAGPGGFGLVVLALCGAGAQACCWMFQGSRLQSSSCAVGHSAL